MPTSNKQNEELLKALQARKSAAQAKYMAVCTSIAKVQNVLNQLGKSAEVPDQAFQVLGGDMLWRNWVERRRSAIMYELARLYSEREDAAQALKRANGRSSAFEAVLEKQRLSEQRLFHRRDGAKLVEMAALQEMGARK